MKTSKSYGSHFDFGLNSIQISGIERKIPYRKLVYVSELQQLIVLLLHLVTIKATSRSDLLPIERLCRNALVWTLLPDEQHCDRFYVCTGRKDHNRSYQELRCEAGYHFSSYEQRCIRGACSQPVTRTCNATGLNNVQRLLGDCTRFERCSNRGELALVKCPYGHYFDAERHACLPVAITPSHQCSCILPEHAPLANLEDCRSYYRCTEGQAVLQQCPQGYYYELSVNSCLLDTRGVCKPEEPAPLLGETLQKCDREGSRLVPHTQDCSRYFVCIGSRAIELSCPKGQYFDLVSRYCTIDKNFQCLKQSTGTEPMTTASPATTKEVNSSKPAQKLNSNKPAFDVIGNKLSSKFLLV